MNGPGEWRIVHVANKRCLLVPSLDSDAVSSFQISATTGTGGQFSFVGNVYLGNVTVYDIMAGNVKGAHPMLEVKGVRCVVVAVRCSGNATVVSLESDGRMALPQSLSDGFLNGANALHLVEIDGRHFILTGVSDASRITAM